MVCTVAADVDPANEDTCRGNVNEGDCATESVGCKWTQRCEYDPGRAQCNAADVPGEAGMLKYIAALSPILVLGIALGIVFPLVIFFCWYVWRCCNCCGGRKANKGFCPCRKNGMCPHKTTPALQDFHYSPKQVWCFKGFFLLFFLITLVGSLVGMAGNALLSDGLQGTVDIFIYELSTTVNTVQRVFAKIVELDEGGEAMDESMTESIDQIKCYVASLQVAINDNAKQVFELRTLAVLVVSLIPMAVTALGLLSALCNSKHMSCCVAVLMSMLMVVVWISFGLHGYLGMIFGDLCLEMDLSLHFEDGEQLIVPFLPSDMNPCSGDSGYDAMFDEIEAGASDALPEGADAIKQFCNKEGDFADLKYFEIDCAAVSGTGKMLTGSEGSYSRNTDTQLTLDVFKWTKDNIFVVDPGINPQMLDGTATLGPSTSCTDDAQEYDETTMEGRCPDKDPDGNCLPGCGTTRPGADNDVIDLMGTTAANLLTIESCPANARKSLEQCGLQGSDGCEFPKLHQLACLITGGMDALAKLADFLELLETDVRPILRCENVKSMFKSIYMPLCVDSVNGFGLVTASNLVGGVIMLLMVPFSVMATKRLDKENQSTAKTAVNQDISYKGASPANVSPNRVVLPPIDANTRSM